MQCAIAIALRLKNTALDQVIPIVILTLGLHCQRRKDLVFFNLYFKESRAMFFPWVPSRAWEGLSGKREGLTSQKADPNVAFPKQLQISSLKNVFELAKHKELDNIRLLARIWGNSDSHTLSTCGNRLNHLGGQFWQYLVKFQYVVTWDCASPLLNMSMCARGDGQKLIPRALDKRETT